MLINTILVERSIEREGLGERLSAEDLRALTPLFHGHINPYGQFTLETRPSLIPRGRLMVCRSPIRKMATKLTPKLPVCNSVAPFIAASLPLALETPR
jgi:hypothetical protein